MANFFQDDQERRVVPNWRTFKKTALFGELDPLNKRPARRFDINLIAKNKEDWNQNHTIPVAADLLSAAVVSNFRTDADVIEAANFIITQSTDATYSQKSLAYYVLRLRAMPRNSSRIDLINAEGLEPLLDPKPLWKPISIEPHSVC